MSSQTSTSGVVLTVLAGAVSSSSSSVTCGAVLVGVDTGVKLVGELAVVGT